MRPRRQRAEAAAEEVAESAPRPSATSPHSQRSARGTRERKVRDRSKDPLIYLLVNLVNGHGYVGKAVNSHRRMWQHETGKHPGPRGKLQLVDKKIQQYGWHNFACFWLETNVPKETLLDREAFWMTLLSTDVSMNGYNILKPGVEGISMDDPEVRKRWEAGNPEGVRKSVETKRKKREEKLAAMDPEVADQLRQRLEQDAENLRRLRRGEAGGPSARVSEEANNKRRATWDRKRMEKVAKMSPEDAAEYLRKNELQRRNAQRNKPQKLQHKKKPEIVAKQKQYRKNCNRSRVRLG